MRRLIIVLLVIIVLALISPAITGSVAQEQFHRSLAELEKMIPGLAFEETQSDSGWFSSTNTQELVLMGMADDESGQDQRSGIFLYTEVFHGPLIFVMGDPDLPVISFGAAVTRSRISFIDEDEETVELPGGIYNRIAYDGSGSLSVIFDAMAEELPGQNGSGGATLNWEGAQLQVDYSSGIEHLESIGHIQPLVITSADGEFRLGEIKFDSSADYSEYDIWIGSSSTSIEELTIIGATADMPQSFSMKGMTLFAQNTLEQGRMTSKITLSIADLEMNGIADNSLQFAISANLDAETLKQMKDTLASQDLADPAAALALRGDGMGLVTAGLAVEISELQINTANGDAQMVFQLEIPPSDLTGEAAAMSAIFSMSADADLRISRSLFDYVLQSNPLMAPQMNALLMSGMLIEQGGQLTMVAIYDGGLLTVNGMPIPLPSRGIFY